MENNNIQNEEVVFETEVNEDLVEQRTAMDVVKDSAFVAGAGFALYGVYTAGKKVYGKFVGPKIKAFKEKRAEKKAKAEAAKSEETVVSNE